MEAPRYRLLISATDGTFVDEPAVVDDTLVTARATAPSCDSRRLASAPGVTSEHSRRPSTPASAEVR
jgi:hypothetical protein